MFESHHFLWKREENTMLMLATSSPMNRPLRYSCRERSDSNVWINHFNKRKVKGEGHDTSPHSLSEDIHALPDLLVSY